MLLLFLKLEGRNVLVLCMDGKFGRYRLNPVSPISWVWYLKWTQPYKP